MPQHPPRKQSHEWWIVLLILLVAFLFRFQDIQTIPSGLHPAEALNAKDAVTTLLTNDYDVFYPDSNGREGLFINIQAQVVDFFGSIDPWVFRIVSAVAGLLTVLGLYQFTKKILNWQIAAISSFLMAVSFWHVMFSRLGFRAILAPLFLVWAFNYLWRGKQTGRLFFYGLSGLFFGLGILSYTAFPIMLFVLIIVLAVYWTTVQKKFSHKKYTETHHQILRGLSTMMIVIILVSLPLAIYLHQNPSLFFDKFTDAPDGIISDSSRSLTQNFSATFEMFTSSGDSNWLFNISGESLLIWPVSVLFLMGLLRTFIKIYTKDKERGHLSTVHVLLISWFFIGIIPSLFAGNIPNAMLTLLVAPVVFIFAGEGLWWIYEFIARRHEERDPHELVIHGKHLSESSFVATLTIIVLLVAVMFVSYDKYFNRWALDPNLNEVFTVQEIDLNE